MKSSTNNSRKKSKRKLITRKAFAESLGVTPQTIYNHVKAGKLKLINGKIDPLLAKKELKKNVDLTHGQSRMNLADEKVTAKREGKAVEGNTFSKAKAFRESYKAKLAELEYKVKIKEYVRAADVESAAFAFARKIRDKMLNVPDRVQADIAAITGLKMLEVRNIIKREIEICLKGV